MLLTLDGSDDDKIKPQGCTKLPIRVPETYDLTQEPASPEEVLQPEEQNGLITEDDEAIHLLDSSEDINEETDVIMDDYLTDDEDLIGEEGEDFWNEIRDDLFY